MRIAMDLIPLAYTLTGIGVYLQQLVAALNHFQDEITIGFTTPCEVPSRWLLRKLLCRNLGIRDAAKLEIETRFGFSPFGPFSKYSSKSLDCTGFDLYHITTTQVPFQRFTKPTVVSVYDLADLRRNGDSQKYESLIPAIRSASKCICISETTQRDVVELLGVPVEKTAVTPLAPRPMFVAPVNDEIRAECRLANNGGIPYLLAVSTIEPRKNYVRMLQAFARVRERGYEVDFLIAGAKRSGWREVASTIEKYRLQDCVRTLGWVDNARLLKLMWGSEALAYASLYEGFGLPVVEAMATGTPVIGSHAGSIPEVVGDTFPLVAAESVESIADRMEQVLMENLAEKTNRAALITRAKYFSWERTAETTLNVYREVVNC
jgi:glycosyltransferase involved in cell wall biosynthesis